MTSYTRADGEIVAVGLVLATLATALMGHYALSTLLCCITIVQNNYQANRQ